VAKRQARCLNCEAGGCAARASSSAAFAIREDMVLRVAAAYESLNDWGSRVPTALAGVA